jgi:tetratricopeptide (TPR) repeat protein
MMIPKRTQKNPAASTPRELFVYLLLGLAILTVYWQVRNHTFVNFDDPTYISENAYLKDGFTLKGLRWSFSFENKDKTYWHPLTWLSHMLDVQLFGLNAGGHLLINVFLHIINSFLLFYLLRRMTGDLWPSAFVAAIFALHPLNVESVAWVAARKNVLSTFFWMLTLWAYAIYCEQPGPARYLFVLLVFALGLMAKPMLVTVPFVLLLLDYWPFERFRFANRYGGQKRLPVFHLIGEKIPLLLLSFVSIFLSSFSLQRHASLISTASVPLVLRIGNAIVSYAGYIGKMIWPYHLSVYYPYPKIIPVWQLIGAGAVIISITIWVLRAYRTKPYLIMGWLWYLGTMLPVLGLVQVGLWPSMADRFGYIPLIGLFIMIAWSGTELISGWRFKKLGLAVTALLISALMVATWLQVGYWKNSITLFKHAVDVDSNNALAHNNFGAALRKQGRLTDAIEHYDWALRLKPDYAAAHYNLGIALMRVGQFSEAISHLQHALQQKPDSSIVRHHLKKALDARQEMNQKMSAIQAALKLTPENAALHFKLANLYERKGDLDSAIRHYKMALFHQPGFSSALNNLAIAYAIKGEYDKALTAFKKLITLQPDSANVHYSIACILARQNKVEESIEWLKTAIQNGYDNWNSIKNDKNLENIRSTSSYQNLIRYR